MLSRFLKRKSQKEEAREPSEDEEEEDQEPEEELSREELVKRYRKEASRKNLEELRRGRAAKVAKKPTEEEGDDEEEEEEEEEERVEKEKDLVEDLKKEKKPGGFKLNRKQIVMIVIAVVAILVLGLLAFFFLPSLLGTPSVPVSVPTVPGTGIIQPQQPTLPKLQPNLGGKWDLSFRVPLHPSDWGLSWILSWVVLILINLFFRSEARHRSEEWDWLNVTIMLLVGWLVIVSAKGIVMIVSEWCFYMISTDCPIKIETIAHLDIGAGIILTIVALVVIVGSMVATFTGRKDFSPWGIGTFSIGILIKLLVPMAAAQTFSGLIMILGLIIYVLEIGGISKMKFESAGLIVVSLGLIIMFLMTGVLTLAYGYLSGAALEFPIIASFLYNGRFILALATAWMMAMGFTFFLMPAIAPQVERLGTGSIVVGDSEKIDAVTILLMAIEIVFTFDLANALMSYL